MTRTLASWIEPTPSGLLVRPANAWVDPAHPAERALITHGHADHARSGHEHVFATPPTLDIVRTRYAAAPRETPCAYGERVALPGGVAATWRPAGHVLGSAQILLEHAGERVVVTGDYKRRFDPTCAPFELTPCDIFITEATFGLPIFRHPPIAGEIAKILEALKDNPDRCVLVGAYALGKAQRVIRELRLAGHDSVIYLHGAMERMCDLYERWGVPLGPLAHVGDRKKEELRGSVVICPPSALTDRWTRRLPDPIRAFASGWMRVRQRAVQKNIELPLIISDHADWPELTDTIRAVGAAETWITHGRDDALTHWCGLHQIKARALALVGREEEDED